MKALARERDAARIDWPPRGGEPCVATRAEAERGVFIDELRTIWEQQQFLPRSPAGRTDASLKTLREARLRSCRPDREGRARNLSHWPRDICSGDSGRNELAARIDTTS